MVKYTEYINCILSYKKNFININTGPNPLFIGFQIHYHFIKPQNPLKQAFPAHKKQINRNFHYLKEYPPHSFKNQKMQFFKTITLFALSSVAFCSPMPTPNNAKLVARANNPQLSERIGGLIKNYDTLLKLYVTKPGDVADPQQALGRQVFGLTKSLTGTAVGVEDRFDALEGLTNICWAYAATDPQDAIAKYEQLYDAVYYQYSHGAKNSEFPNKVEKVMVERADKELIRNIEDFATREALCTLGLTFSTSMTDRGTNEDSIVRMWSRLAAGN